MPGNNTRIDYKSTVFLPKTDLPIRVSLPKLEVELLKRWDRISLYQRLRQQSLGKEKFVLHDGPPYANGHLHIGHALNKILKDFVIKAQQMTGLDANYVPGWDCHGLPIEWKIEEQYRASGQEKNTTNILTFRQDCRAFADHWMQVQAKEFRRLGIMGDWDKPYTTMAYTAEASIVAELGHFLMSGNLYRGNKPVLWSVVEKTALAEAEVEYHDRISTILWIRFPVVQSELPDISDSVIVIWTTTPWTLPGNQAIAYNPAHTYAVIEVREVNIASLAHPGEKLIIAYSLVDQTAKSAGITTYTLITRIPGKALLNTVCAHPWRGYGYDSNIPLLEADFVSSDKGTGFVHIAPGHGEDDWNLGKANGLKILSTVTDSGFYYENIPLFKGKHIFTVDEAVIKNLQSANSLLAHGQLVHSYPYSWRSKSPLIIRTTPQWFIDMEHNNLREKALTAIDSTRWIPEKNYNRIRSMVKNRPDWCISRQRAWGVPITIFVNGKTGEPLRDRKVFDRIVTAIQEEGCDIWFTADPCRFLGQEYAAEDFEKVTDILDVWFDSGCTHAFVLGKRSDLRWPASLYLEGSDQHRGWFQASLLESCGTRGCAPYETVLTHGFVMGSDGQKMSKSVGNIVTPRNVVEEFGADVLRLWVAGSDYTDDLCIGPEILKQISDIYHRLRNTLRYLLGSLNDFTEAERVVDLSSMPELERWVLHRLWQLNKLIHECLSNYNFHTLFSAIHTFCSVELSTFYFDIRKDSLYCDRFDSLCRRSVRTVLDIVFHMLVRWLAPFISFTADEVWLSRFPSTEDSVHLKLFLNVPSSWQDEALAAKWNRIRQIRRVITSALEAERKAKRIRSSLQAAPLLYVKDDDAAMLRTVDLSSIAITSALTVRKEKAPVGAYVLPDVLDIAVVPEIAVGKKCQRCWKVLPDVGSDQDYGDICERCIDAVNAFDRKYRGSREAGKPS